MTDVKKIPAAVAMLKVIESYGVKDVFGYPGGSINSTLAALDQEKDNINYVQIRHEQVGALAAAAHAKLTGKIGVAFGSAGPGAVNLLNGLYDAKEDHAPVLAIVGQVGHDNMNYNYFQEFPETPMFSDVSVYDRIVMTPESLPHVVDRAIHEAYQNKGVAVVVIPNDFGFDEIPDVPYSSASKTYDKPAPEPVASDDEVSEALKMIKNAKRPVLHVGRGIKGNGDKLIELSKKLQIPIIMDGLALGYVDASYEGNLGTANRAASKAADEILSTADLVIAIGGDFPFAKSVYASHPFAYIQVDNSRIQLGRHHEVDLPIWSDSGSFIDKALAQSEQVAPSPFFKAAVADEANWKEYINKMLNVGSDEQDKSNGNFMDEFKDFGKHLKDTITNANSTMPVAPIYKQINRVADKDAVFSIDVGDNIINSFRYLDIQPTNKWVISALFATMGSGLPGAIAAKRAYPDRQVFNIAGDGALSMVIQDLVTLTKYQLPVINVVTSNEDLSFIKGEQDDLPMQIFGLQLQGQSFELIAKGMGVDATTVRNVSELPAAFDKAVKVTKAGHPFLIDAKINQDRGLPVEDLVVKIENGQVVETVSPNYLKDKNDNKTYTLPDFFAEYGGEGLLPLKDFFDKYDVQL
ncbi:thiamine pyrophosphate-binding protein [Fructilactobacillus fructivorans]|uniref:Pyruvate oxidase n=1 Tax=Fructilactobacillus fructivorans TaxID=1614 RepID=A0A0C1PR95_9LACO|nr:thiamine pyrophosphate-binding protein [Fructilactobacillus fructivorans]KID42406.1 Pyruvate oxidase [Fructilactobacillus fructivorans]MCT0150980.1 pyruvate oxidase [Fructilactobacillus fructivorans]MCT2867463.1 pyruvate oxidase [Fructilactobacillus fructivorans]MCT2869019.1 pyruvate oxidase [Fructilactobacillus fructivorans]MCT2873262.1 pyruvate oxidase [Fructilactobacillus fructivorans]